jgi:large subunit ribosomal protein L10
VRPYSRTVRVRGGLLGGRAIDADALQRLSTLPSREVLLARLAGGLQAPMSGMAAVLAGNIRNLVGVLTAIADKKQPPQTDGGAAA